jgi:signal transduction histidine kinase
MKERATAVGGQLAILPTPQHGTTVRARVPLQE